MKSKLIFIHAFSSLHAGTGQSVGAIDLAIAREKATGIPFLPGTSIKGVLRSNASNHENFNTQNIDFIFGPPPEQSSGHSGSISFGDARLLFLPVRSLAGTFAYVTSPFLLERMNRDLEAVGEKSISVKGPSDVSRCFVADDEKSLLTIDSKVIFEDLDFTRELRPEVAEIIKVLGPMIFGENGVEKLEKRFCIVHDDVMSFLLEQATEVRARIRLEEETKVVAQGALWYQESLPTETILVSMLTAFPPKYTQLSTDQVFEKINPLFDSLIQFGGNATIGEGFCKVKMIP